MNYVETAKTELLPFSHQQQVVFSLDVGDVGRDLQEGFRSRKKDYMIRGLGRLLGVIPADKKPAQRDHGKERHERFRPADHQSENQKVDDGHRQDLGHRSPGQKRPGIVRECMESDRQEEVAGPDVNAAESEAHQELKEQ